MFLSKEELTKKVISDRPHVVILGAGASRAACPNGDVNGKKLPLMNDLVDCLNLKQKLEEWEIDSTQNFEDIFSKLFEQNEHEKTDELQKIIHNYFNSLKLPDEPTLYDHLVLALRETDLIASFNWDPLLLQAYGRNSSKGIRLPRLVFLHGNVKVATCKEHNGVNYVGEVCKLCHKILEPVNLLYPIYKKDYGQTKMLKVQWQRFQRHLEDAFQFTIFGYSAPKTDADAVSMMKEAWKEQHRDRLLADTTVINPNTGDDTYEHWNSFIHSDYFTLVDDFYKSDIAMYPRRGFERSCENNMKANFVEENPIPKNLSFPDLWRWFHQFVQSENEYRIKHPFPPPPKWHPDAKK